MLTVEDYANIRIAKPDGMSIRAICRTHHHSHHTVAKALANPQPRPYTRTKPTFAPVLGPFMPIIDQILLADRTEPAKQRHRASKIYRRLRDEYGSKGGYDQVRRYVKKRRKRQRETFIPLAHDPGQRLEADFGHIYVDFPWGRERVPVLLTTWSHSSFRFGMALPSEAKVDKYQTVRFETNRYSVPRRWAFEMVTVKAYPFGIRIVASDRPIAYHKRCYGRHQQILEPLHYLAVLGRRPAALDHSDVFGSWQLPACFAELRDRLERREGPFAGARQYIRILQLLAEHPLKRIQEAVELCMAGSTIHAQVIINTVHRLAQKQPYGERTEPNPTHCYQIQVPKPNLNKFDQYLTTVHAGEAHYV